MIPQDPNLGLQIIAKNRHYNGQEAINYATKNGLCTICGIFQTHEKNKSFFKKKRKEPLTVTNNRGIVTVYKGFCISPTCYKSVDQVKELLGETPRRNRATFVKKPSDVRIARLSYGSAFTGFSGNRNLASPGIPPLSDIDVSNGFQESSYLHTSSFKKSGNYPSPSKLQVSNSPFCNSSGNHSDSRDGRSGHVGAEMISDNHSVPFQNCKPNDSSHIRPSLKYPNQSRQIVSDHPVVLDFKSLLLDGDYVAFLHAFEQRAIDTSLVLKGLELFRKSIVRDQMERGNGVVLGGHGWVKAVFGKIDDLKFYNDREVLLSSLATVLTLSNLPGTYKVSMVKKGVIDKLLKIMNDFPKDREVITLVCSIFASVTSNERNGLNGKYEKVALVVQKLVELLLSDGLGAGQHSLRPLSNLSNHRKRSLDTGKSPWYEVKDLVGTDEITRAIIKVIQSDNVEISSVEAALSLLWKLSLPREEQEIESMFPISNSLVKSIVESMRQMKYYYITLAGCGILTNLALREGFPVEWAQPAVSAINQFLSDCRSQVDDQMAISAIHTFCNFLANTGTRPTVITDPQFLQSSLSMLKRFPSCEELVEVACLLIARASIDNTDAKEMILNLGGLELVLNAFKQYATFIDNGYSFEVKDAILCAIASLSACESGAQQILETSLLNEIQQLLAVEEDEDFQSLLEVVVRNVSVRTSNGLEIGLNARPQRELRQQPGLFSYLLSTAKSEGVVVSLLQDLNELGEAGMEAYENEGFDALLVAMDTYQNSSSVQEYGCQALAQTYFYLSFNDIGGPTHLPTGGWAMIYREQATICMLNAIRAYRNNPGVQYQAVCALSNFLCPIAARLDLYSPERFTVSQWLEMSLDEIVNTMNTNESNADFQKRWINLLWAIFTICIPESLQHFKLRALQRIFDSMRIMQDDRDVLVAGCDAIMALENDQDSLNFMGDTFVEQLVESLDSTDIEVVSRFSGVLAFLFKKAITASNHAVQMPNAIYDLISCMKSNEFDPKIQTNVCYALEGLINVDDFGVRATIVQHGGLYAVCDALSFHMSSPILVQHACRVLCSIVPSSDGNMIASMRKALGDTLLEVLCQHIDNAETEAAVIDALWTCCGQDEYFKDILVNKESLSTIVQIMNRNLGSAEVQQSCSSLLWILSGYGNGKDAIGACGGVSAVVNALFAHNESTAIQKEGLAALKNLATTTNNKRLIEQVGGEDAVLYALQIHYNIPQVISTAYSALNNIAVDSETKIVKLMSDQTFEYGTSAMARFPMDEGIQKNICFYLKSCSYMPGNVEVMHRHSYRLIPLLNAAATNFPQHCHDRAIRLIEKMEQYG